LAGPYIAIVGGGEATEIECGSAEQAGALLAERGAVLVTGGRGGVMEAACRGARSAGGLTVGILPGEDRAEGNQWLSVALPTGLGELRNGLIVRAADCLLAIGGSYGTLSEVALALRTRVPVVGLGTWEIDGIEAVPTVRDAVDRTLALSGGGPDPRLD